MPMVSATGGESTAKEATDPNPRSPERWPSERLRRPPQRRLTSPPRAATCPRQRLRPATVWHAVGMDLARIRSQFPALDRGAAHFDGPGGSQTPTRVAEAVAGDDDRRPRQPGPVTAAERSAEDVVVGARAAIADLLGADPRGVVFGRSMTQLTFDLARTLARGWATGRRGRGDPARPRRQHPALGARRRGGRRHGALARLRPGDRRARRRSSPC